MGICIKCKKVLEAGADHICHSCYMDYLNKQSESIVDEGADTSAEEPGSATDEISLSGLEGSNGIMGDPLPSQP